MELLHQEKYPGNDDNVYKIKIFDQHSYLEAAINVIVVDNGEENEINMVRNEYPSGTPISEIIEKSKGTISSLTFRL